MSEVTSKKPALYAAMASAFALGLATADEASAAAILFTSRDSAQVVTFSDLSAFSDASLGATTTLGVAGAQGDSTTLGYVVPSGTTGFSVVSLSSSFSVTAPIFTPGMPNGSQSFAISGDTLGGATGAIQTNESLAVGAAPPGAIATLTTGLLGGVHFLDETYNPIANQTVGSPFNFSVVLPGNYSAVGTSTGDHQLISLGGAWTINQNWVFNGSTTTFSASIATYQGIGLTPLNLEYQIYGAAPVPLPASAWLLLGGLGTFSMAARRSHRTHSATKL